jgi:hypothetical protein
MSDQPAEGKTADPLEQWRVLRDVYMDAWAKAMGEAVNSEAYTQVSGAVLDTCLTASSPFRDAQKKATVTALEQLNMPSRADFASLAERFSNMELLLDDMAAKLDQLCQLATTEPRAETKAPQAVAQPKSEPALAAQPIRETKIEPTALAQPVSEPVPEVKSEVKSEAKPAARREAAKSAKKGSR